MYATVRMTEEEKHIQQEGTVLQKISLSKPRQILRVDHISYGNHNKF